MKFHIYFPFRLCFVCLFHLELLSLDGKQKNDDVSKKVIERVAKEGNVDLNLKRELPTLPCN